MDFLECRRSDFPIFNQGQSERELIYLDSGATTQKPASVIQSLKGFYSDDNANIHRAVYELGERATQRYENARVRIAEFLNAPSSNEVIFVRGATEAINLVASSLSSRLQAGDEIVITHLEHHANIVPWQLACQRTGAILKVIPINEHGELCLDELDHLVSDKTKIMAFNHISNALGTVNDVKYLCDYAKQRGILTLIDGAQAIAHTPVDVQDLGCDFYVFSGHKLYGPTGIGILWGREALLNELPPYQGGGDMIEDVYFEQSTYKAVPSRFEAGTPNIAGAVGLATAIDYVDHLGIEQIQRYESELVNYGAEVLSDIKGLRLIGTPSLRASAISFLIDGTHPHDVGTLLDQYGIAVRVGHHCAQPIMRRFGISATTRASIAVYNQKSDFDHLVKSLHRIIKMLS